MRKNRFSELKAQKRKSQEYFVKAVHNQTLDLATRGCRDGSPRTATNVLVVPSFD